MRRNGFTLLTILCSHFLAVNTFSSGMEILSISSILQDTTYTGLCTIASSMAMVKMAVGILHVFSGVASHLNSLVNV